MIEKELAYWIYYEDGHKYYCGNCIDKRIEEINRNQEFSEEIDYENGETCGYFEDWADVDDEIECELCNAPLLSNIDSD